MVVVSDKVGTAQIQAVASFTGTSGTLTNRADFPSVKFEPTGQKYDFLCCFVFHIKNGKIDHVHEYFDMETIKR